MLNLNIEIKARCTAPDFIRNYLKEQGALFKGTDWQRDTYFNVEKGRLKLREGNIENNLIYYDRNNEAGPKSSDFKLVKVDDAAGLKKILEESVGVKIVVVKKREIYYIGNVKFHIDELEELGSFVEIEAGNLFAELPAEKLREQCEFYLREFRISEKDLLSFSYSDMLLGEEEKKSTG